MPKNTARIGKDDEREIVKDLEKRGYRARRQPGSGNRAVDLQHDIVWESPAGRLHIESKWRKESQWKTLENYRAGADILTLKCDGRMQQHSQRMIFMSWELFLDLVGDAQPMFEASGGIPYKVLDNRWPKGRKIPTRPMGKRVTK